MSDLDIKTRMRIVAEVNERSGEKTAAQAARDALARIEELEARVAELNNALWLRMTHDRNADA